MRWPALEPSSPLRIPVTWRVTRADRRDAGLRCSLNISGARSHAASAMTDVPDVSVAQKSIPARAELPVSVPVNGKSTVLPAEKMLVLPR